MKLVKGRKPYRRLYLRAIKRGERHAVRLVCLRWLRGQEAEAE